MRQIVIVMALDGIDKDYEGNDLLIGEELVAHRRYDGSYREDVEQEVSRAFARLLRNELVRTPSTCWSGERPKFREEW